ADHRRKRDAAGMQQGAVGFVEQIRTAKLRGQHGSPARQPETDLRRRQVDGSPDRLIRNRRDTPFGSEKCDSLLCARPRHLGSDGKVLASVGQAALDAFLEIQLISSNVLRTAVATDVDTPDSWFPPLRNCRLRDTI